MAATWKHAQTVPGTTCTTEAIWTSGKINKWGRFDAFIDYRWECGCGHRYGNATPELGNVDAQHTAHLGGK